MIGNSSSVFTIIKLIIIVAVAVTFIISALSLMTASYAEWQEYYNAVMAEKEMQKYLNSLPLTFEGISVSLKEDVTIYDNGRATVSKDDLHVVAHFSEKGIYTDKILSSSEFDIEVPENFSKNGGTVIVRYLYQPAKAEGATEEPAPITRSAEVKVELVPISITALNVITNPYRVYYKESETFDISGIELEAVLNCGDTVSLDENNINVITSGRLTAGMDSIKISFTNDGVTVETEIPVTVKSAAEYNDGEIESIQVEENIYLLAGQSPTEAKPVVRATYKNGNRLIVASEELNISANVAQASIFERCTLNISLKSNSAVSCEADALIRLVAEAEDATAVGGSSNTVEIDGALVTVIEQFADGDSLTFTINSSVALKGRLSLSVANTSYTILRPSSIITLKINGRVYLVPANSVIAPKSASKDYTLVDCVLPDVVLKEGNNVIEIGFSNMRGVNLAVAALNVDTDYTSAAANQLTFGEQVASNKDNNADATNSATATPTVGTVGRIEVNVHKEKGQLYSMGGVSDGQYIYVSMNADKNVATVISKIDPATNTVVAQTKSFVPGPEKIDNSRLFIIENTLYCIIQDGSMYEIDLDGFNRFEYEVTKSQLSFAAYGTAFDATWNESTGRIAVVTKDGMLHILNSNMSAVISNISVSGSNSITSDDKFIYVSFMDGRNTIVEVYDWLGEKIDRVSATEFKFGSETKYNVQALYVHNGELRAAVCSWGDKNKAAFFDWKITVNP